MTPREQMVEIARGNVERFLEIGEDGDIYEEAYTLAIDALHDAGYQGQEAVDVAVILAMSYANP